MLIYYSSCRNNSSHIENGLQSEKEAEKLVNQYVDQYDNHKIERYVYFSQIDEK